MRGCGNPASGFYGAAMRLGVLDIGSNTVHLLVVDAAPDARPLPAVDERSVVRLMRYVDSDGAVTDRGVAALTTAVRKAVKAAAKHDVDELIGLATSALREAVNGQDVLARLSETAGVPLQVHSGPAEAELTFLAARRWHGWAAGRLLVLDIGGGSFEVALGLDETPEYAVSVPLGASRLTKEFFPDDPPGPTQIDAVKAHVKKRSPRSCPTCPRLTTWSRRRRRFGRWLASPGTRSPSSARRSGGGCASPA